MFTDIRKPEKRKSSTFNKSPGFKLLFQQQRGKSSIEIINQNTTTIIEDIADNFEHLKHVNLQNLRKSMIM